ncbi:YdeI/OmpD-associated family protein [Ulvibacterium sp.]|uniref:YdeI/OmpD-associated family protein n=1 Tax=Ulvibacterium sp. TaxID=2665914 RepID=UPI00261F816A|nr:YdeI/OmpD-associated family protein [Ulvibacterium sp.]
MQSNVFEIAITGNHHSLLLPEDIVFPFLEKNLKRVRAKATFNGKELTFHGAIQKRNGRHYMMFGKRYQKELGVFPNDYFQLQFFEDTSKYGVEMPEELEAVLQSDFEAQEIFESFTPGKKRGIIYMILGYKNPQTRIDKSILVCENLKRGIRNNPDLLKSF